MKNFNSDNSTGKNYEEVKPNMPLKYLTATSIIGDKVMNPGGEHMGTIRDIMINLTTGSITYFIIEFEVLFAFGDKFFAFPYTLFTVDPINETFVLDQEPDTLKNAPGFDKDHWPDTNSHEFDHPSNYWAGFMGPNTGSSPH